MKVLLIDDEPDDLKALERELTSSKAPSGEYYEAKCFTDYEDALNPAYDGEKFDILITDMVMGRKRDEGIAVLKYFADRLPVTIVLTGHPSVPNCVEAMKAGAWDYIEKNPADGADPYERLLDSLKRSYEYKLEHPERGITNPDSEWVHDNLDKLMTEYPGQLVAVLYEKVVDSDASFTELSKRLEARFPLAKPTIISIPDSDKEGVP